jgi:hypothetical protein
MKCPFCSEEINDNAIKCKHCGEVLNQSAFSSLTNHYSKESNSYIPEDDEVKAAFDKIDANNGKFVGVFNLYALLLGIIWYMIKGMWAKAFILFILVLISGGLLAIPLWIYCSFAGYYDYYLFKVKGKKLW